MISNISKIAVFALVLFMLNACISPPSYPPTPRIEFRSFSDTLINQLESFDVVIYFEDGDGDLGSDFSDPAACTNPCLPETVDTSCFNNSLFNIFAVDDRTGCILASGAIIPDIPAKGSTNAISGEMIISVGPVCCFDRVGGQGGCVPLPDYPRDSLTFKLRIRDKAGNFSNELSVGPVFINCN
jgi:hypothetical protein